MKRILVDVPGHRYDLCIGGGLLSEAGSYLADLNPTKILIVTDSNVGPLYARQLQKVLTPLVKTHTCTLVAGEENKTFAAVEVLLEALFDLQADRRSVVVALGGGVVGDIAGFAASIYMRGIRFVQMPTTLLAQVDSSVGGKTGVNHSRGKNMVGAFHQPALVLMDTDTLQTLPPRELSAGLAEILKHGLLADADYFDRTVAALPQLLSCEPQALQQTIARSCEIKAQVVARDEKESGERALLNLGHTFGHAIEALSGYGTWLHGEAVGCGLCLAADLSQREGLLDAAAVAKVVAAVERARLPSRIAGLSKEDALQSMRGDKKSEAGEIRFILLERIGRAVQRKAEAAAVESTLTAAGFV